MGAAVLGREVAAAVPPDEDEVEGLRGAVADADAVVVVVRVVLVDGSS